MYFAEKAVDIAVIEVGLGGRLDATNIVRPDVAIVTEISLDHTQVLGDTLPEIAREKAGIFKACAAAITVPQAPDVIDIGVGHTATAMADGLVAKYKVADWDTIEMKDPDGHWWAEYYGVLVFEIVKPDIVESPQDWEDLLKPEYKGSVAMAGDVLKSNQSVQTVLAAGLSRTGGDIETAPEAGLEFWKEMVANGNFIPVIADQGRIAARETLITMEWDYLALANRDTLAGNPELEIVVPASGVVAGPYAGGISAYAPHPYAARLWWEFVMSDEGQNLYLKGYAHPIRFNDMVKRGVVPQEMLDKLPPAEAYQKATFLTVDQLQVANKYITENWRRVVYGE
jgi:putative spermidine/putrescine transport system substrate-binding protein